MNCRIVRLSLSVCLIVTFSTCCHAQTTPATPKEPPVTPLAQSPDVHTNVTFAPIGGYTQEMKVESPWEAIKLGTTAVPGIQALSLPSDQVPSSADVIARYAIASGQSLPEGVQLKAHTDFKIEGKGSTPSPIVLAAVGHNINNSPGEIIARYGIGGTNPVRGLIVVVDAYDYPTAESDLALFSTQFQLPTCSVKNGCLTVKKVDPVKTLPDTDSRVPHSECGWSVESALDLQWAHAINPSARLVLVEAVSSSVDDLFQAVDIASGIAEANGGGIVSMSWSFPEVSDETKYDVHFLHDTVLYFAASGDKGGVVEYPAASPLVISVGGTQVVRDASNKMLSEVAWDGSGGGFSIPEIRPPFQGPSLENLENTSGRVTPDIAGPAGIDLRLDNGSPLYAGTICRPNVPSWYAAGGTSLATPIIAAAASLSLPKGRKTSDVLQNIYDQRKTATAVRDITFGRAGNNFAKTGYDPVTGVGVPAGLKFILPIQP